MYSISVKYNRNHGGQRGKCPSPNIFAWGGLALPKNELLLYSEYTNRSRPVRVLLASEHAALFVTAVYSIAGHIILLKDPSPR